MASRYSRILRLVCAVPLALLPPFLALFSLACLWLADLVWLVLGQRRTNSNRLPRTDAASVVIPNWNGKDLLEKYLPSVVEALSGNPNNELIVVDNGSSDGSAASVREHFPTVRLLELSTNLGFGGGSNAGFRAAQNDIVVLLNSDMRVESGFLPPLLAGFTDAAVFAVSCQIFFSDPARVREETGLTQAWWESGALRVRHRLDDAITDPFPCFYGGGGSCAFDRAKFLELGGFDELLRPFYLEDTDLGYMAWKRGWKVLYQPQSVVFHEHRGTIGKKFSASYIQGVLKKNFLLFCWKNIHEPRRLASHFLFSSGSAILSLFGGDSPERSSLTGQWRALLQIPQAIRSRWHARQLAAVSDTEAFRRPLGGYFRDRFETLPASPEPLNVLFVSPYPISPPIHGGGVFMYQTLRALTPLCRVHLIELLDFPHEREAQEELAGWCASAEFLVRLKGKRGALMSHLPHAVLEFANSDLEWLVHRQAYLKKIDVFQLEYTHMGQYGGAYRHLAAILFEHDIYFQSVGRALAHIPNPLSQAKAAYEYLRALRYELTLLPKMDRIQVCSSANRSLLTSFAPQLDTKIDDLLRAGIATSDYPFCHQERSSNTMLFLGSFRHLPNREAVDWFASRVLPLVLNHQPDARLILIGSEPPPLHSLPGPANAIELQGFVDDIREPLQRHALFICPILSGSGMRVKLLEAFASGIPVVSTRMGAEGLAEQDGEYCFLADDPHAFAGKVVSLLQNPEQAKPMVERARRMVEEQRDMTNMTSRLVESYRAEVARKRS